MRKLVKGILALTIVAGTVQGAEVEPTSTGTSVVVSATSGNWTAFLVPETDEGGTDLNGDTDANDAVLHVFDHLTGSVRNLGLAVEPTNGPLVIERDVVVFAVSEPAQGVDYNNDGFLFGSRLHRYDAARNRLFELPVGVEALFGIGDGAGRVAFLASERWTGVDMNGDTDGFDHDVLNILDVATGGVTNVGFVIAGTPPEMRFGPGRLSFSVAELRHGSDLNGDGDAVDTVRFWRDMSSGAVTNFGFHGIGFIESDEWTAFSTNEFVHGKDINGDGDVDDDFIVAIRYETGEIKLASSTGELLAMSDRLVYFEPRELFLGDRNGDGDTLDHVGHVFDLADDSVTSVGLATDGPALVDDAVVYFGVSEPGQFGADRDGDGDATGIVLAAYDADTGLRRDYGFEFEAGPLRHEDQLVFAIPESSLEGDANGDGDEGDTVFHRVDVAGDGTRTNLGVVGTDVRIDAGTFAAVASEAADAVDRNGDGDATDAFPVRVDLTSLAKEEFAAAATVASSEARRMVLHVSESDDGATDGNGDGDADDTVLALSDAPCGPGTVGAAAGDPVDVLTVNGSAGGASRRMTADADAPFAVSLAKAPVPARGSRYYVAVFAGRPGPSTTGPMPKSIGEGCFQPIRVLSGYAMPLHVANELLPPSDPRLDGSTAAATGIPGGALPGDVLVIPAAAFAPGDVVTVQGMLGDGQSPSTKRISLTNAVVVGIL